jgi:hypothetical protein
MPVTTMPSQRIARMLREGARFTVTHPHQTSIDITPDVIAMLDWSNGILTALTGSNPVQTPKSGRQPCVTMHQESS